jgi:citrate lyase subunit beta/citryl-CoA lyase
MTRADRARLIRSLCFVSSDDDGQATAALAAGADAVWFDLEDYVVRDQLGPTRERIGRLVRQLGGAGHTVMVRVHTTDEPGELRRDLEAVLCPELYGLLLPKAEAGSVRVVAGLLDDLEADFGLAGGRTVLFPQLESALAVERAFEIASESARIAHMGSCVNKDGDPARSIGFRWTADGRETLYIRSRVLLAARAAGVPFPIGNWYWPGYYGVPPGPPSEQMLAGLGRFAARERDLGFLGAPCAPVAECIEVVNSAFTPADDQIRLWQELIATEEAANRGGRKLYPSRAKYARAQLDLVARIRSDRGRPGP